MQTILAIDQGTTGSTALVLDPARGFKVLGRSNIEFKQHYPQPGWVEHDLDELWSSVLRSIEAALQQAQHQESSFTVASIAAIGITNQRETLCVFDRRTGKPLRRAIVWQCRRSTAICQSLKVHEPIFKKRTGLLLDPYFTGSKIAWVLQNESLSSDAVFGTIDCYLLHRLSGEFKTEASNASRTLIYDIDRGNYDTELCALFGLKDLSRLPPVHDSVGTFGHTRGLGILPDGIPIAAMIGDQQAALAGQACFEPGQAKCTYGTGAFLLSQLGQESPRASILTTVAWQLKGKRSFAFEGAAFVAGAAVQFLRDQLSFVTKASEAEDLAVHAIGAPEVYFVPALSGLGAPYWEPQARGAFFGLTRGTTKQQMIRAALESIAFQVNDLIASMNEASSVPVREIGADGGAAANALLMQYQADLSQVHVRRPKNLETTALGAGMFAALGVGLVNDLQDLKSSLQLDQSFVPQKRSDLSSHQEGWKRAVDATLVFAGSTRREGLK